MKYIYEMFKTTWTGSKKKKKKTILDFIQLVGRKPIVKKSRVNWTFGTQDTEKEKKRNFVQNKPR